MRTVTLLLKDWRAGDPAALGELMPVVYAELHRIAASYVRRERPGQTLRPTDLVSEAYLRLAAGTEPDLENRAHFFAIAARTMRQILVDQARKRAAGKRGGGERAVTLDDQLAMGERPAELLALDAALEELAAFDARKARIVELLYFGGLTQDEIAKIEHVHINTVGRDLKLAEAWLHQRLREPA